MASIPPLASIESGDSYTLALVCQTLRDHGIPSLAYGVAALQCYNVELCLIDIELTVQDSDIDALRTLFASAGLSQVSDDEMPLRDDYGRKGVLYFEPPSSASAAWNDTAQKVYIVVYPQSMLRLNVIEDAAKTKPQIPNFTPERFEGSVPSYQIPDILSLRRSFLHRFLTSSSPEEEARLEMLLAYLHRELRKPPLEEYLYDIPKDLKPCLDLVLKGNAGYDETREIKEAYRGNLG
ncbi:hypothetical protein ABKN59_000923 [Abortiporus biennis]